MELALDQMTIEEKLRLLDKIWDALISQEEDVPSPSWHQEVLEERERNLRSGREKSYDWKNARHQILNRVHED